MTTLSFSRTNRKMNALAALMGLPKTQVIAFDLPAGYTCPAASLCLSMSNRETGKIVDGPDMQFRCYAASIEAVYKNVRNSHWNNYDALRACGNDADAMADLIQASMPKGTKIVRIHASGDFFNKVYFQAWVIVANRMPEVKFFGYTKVLPFALAAKPDNFHLQYSFGGKMDAKAQALPVPTCYVVTDHAQAEALNAPVICEGHGAADAEDFEHIMAGKSFALLVHGTQPKN